MAGVRPGSSRESFGLAPGSTGRRRSETPSWTAWPPSSTREAWAVGARTAAGGTLDNQPLILRWNGTRWGNR